jgi:hypothetical protein
MGFLFSKIWALFGKKKIPIYLNNEKILISKLNR